MHSDLRRWWLAPAFAVAFAVAPAVAQDATPTTPQETTAPENAPTPEQLAAAATQLAQQPLPGTTPPDATQFDAWRLLRRAGRDAVPALKAEIAKLVERVDQTPGPQRADAKARADYFRVMAASLLYQAAGLDEAATIATLWKDAGAARALAPRAVYGPAYWAAVSGDARAYPMLVALLADTQSDVQFKRGNGQAVLDWPDTHAILWAAAGEAAEPALLAVLGDEKADDATLASAVWVVSKQALPAALADLRRIAARDGAGLAKCTAVEALGVFGHPSDFDVLRQGLQQAVALPLDHADRAALVAAYINALAEFGDLRAAADLTPLMKSGDLGLREHARKLIVYLLTPDGLAEMRAAASELKGQERADADAGLAQLFAAIGVPANEYDALDADARTQAVTRFRDSFQADYEPVEGDPIFALGELLAAMAAQRTTALEGDFAEARPRHILAVATLADRSAMLGVRQAMASALVPEVLDDLDVLSAILTRLTRATYRQPTGFAEQVEPLAAQE